MRRSDEPEEIQKKLQRDPDLFLVAESRGRLVGTIIGGFDGRRGLIYHLAVDAAFRQHGIGSLLMDEVERRLKAKGCLKCYLMVAVDNDDAMRFYETAPLGTHGYHLHLHQGIVEQYGPALWHSDRPPTGPPAANARTSPARRWRNSSPPRAGKWNGRPSCRTN